MELHLLYIWKQKNNYKKAIETSLAQATSDNIYKVPSECNRIGAIEHVFTSQFILNRQNEHTI